MAKDSITLVELLNVANAGYTDGFLSTYYDEETGELLPDGSGDGLAKFIVIELRDTFDPEATREDQFLEARRVMKVASQEIDGVIFSLFRNTVRTEIKS